MLNASSLSGLSVVSNETRRAGTRFGIMCGMKQMFVLAGANGSGKSTIAKVLLPTVGIVHVNPDDIARELNPLDFASVKIAAGRETLRRVDELMTRGASFAIETTLSGLAYVKMIERARQLDYEIILAYVYVDSSDVCIARIASRVKNGGHSVPDADVRRRYVRSKRNFLGIYAPLADHWTLYYNGGSDITLVAHGNGALSVLSQERFDAFKGDICLT